MKISGEVYIEPIQLRGSGVPFSPRKAYRVGVRRYVNGVEDRFGPRLGHEVYSLTVAKELQKERARLEDEMLRHVVKNMFQIKKPPTLPRESRRLMGRGDRDYYTV